MKMFLNGLTNTLLNICEGCHKSLFKIDIRVQVSVLLCSFELSLISTVFVCLHFCSLCLKNVMQQFVCAGSCILHNCHGHKTGCRPSWGAELEC